MRKNHFTPDFSRIALSNEKNPFYREKFEKIVEDKNVAFISKSLEGNKKKQIILQDFSFFYGDWVEDENYIVLNSMLQSSSSSGL